MDNSEGLPKLTRGGKKGERTFVAPNARSSEERRVGDDGTALCWADQRTDMAPITIGSRSNVQDNAVIHESIGHPVTIGSNVSIGHGAIIHGCTIEDDCLIGMGAIILNGAVIGRGSLIAAGALVSERKVIPPNSLVMGVPGKVVRELTEEEAAGNLRNADTYVDVGRRYRNEWA